MMIIIHNRCYLITFSTYEYSYENPYLHECWQVKITLKLIILIKIKKALVNKNFIIFWVSTEAVTETYALGAVPKYVYWVRVRQFVPIYVVNIFSQYR